MFNSSIETRWETERPHYGPIHDPMQWRVDRPILSQAATSIALAIIAMFALVVLGMPSTGYVTGLTYTLFHETAHCVLALGCSGGVTIEGAHTGYVITQTNSAWQAAMVAAAGPLLPVLFAALLIWSGVTRRATGTALLLIGLAVVSVGLWAQAPPGVHFILISVGLAMLFWAVLPVYPTVRATGVLIVGAVLLVESYRNRVYLFAGQSSDPQRPSDVMQLAQNAGFGTPQDWALGLSCAAIGIVVITATCLYNWAERRRHF